jgi:hypothetical protein
MPFFSPYTFTLCAGGEGCHPYRRPEARQQVSVLGFAINPQSVPW